MKHVLFQACATVIALFSCMALFGQTDLEPFCKYGYVDANGKVVIELQYDGAQSFSEGLAAVRVGDWSDGKWGYIDEKGKTVIAPQFSEAEMFSSGLAAVSVRIDSTEKWGYIDKTGKWVIKPQFDGASRFSGDIASIRVGDWSEGKWGCIDRTGKMLIQPQFGSALSFMGGTVASVEINGKRTLINNKGKIVVEFPTGSEFYFSNDKDGLVRLVVDGKDGVVDVNGWVLEPKYDNVSIYDGFVVVEIDSKTGVYLKSGKWLIEPTEDMDYGISFDEDVLPVILDGKWGLVNKSGWVLEPQEAYARFGDVSERMVPVYVDGSWGYLGTDGRMALEPQYDEAESFHEGLAGVRLDGKWGFIDKNGKMVIEPRFSDVNRFSMGLAAFENEDGKWGFMDRTGKVVIAPRFDYAGTFDSDTGKAWARMGDFETGESGYVDMNGTFTPNE